jgi:hypothetical protein
MRDIHTKHEKGERWKVRPGDIVRGDCKEDAFFVNESGLEKNTISMSTLSEHPRWISIPSYKASMLRGMRF